MSRVVAAASSGQRAPAEWARFGVELRALGKEVRGNVGIEHYRHLRKVEGWGRLATLIGVATSWIAPNPLSVLGLGLGRSTRWLIMHEIGHGGYDRIEGIPPRYTSRRFARGRRRFLDWFDWYTPEAWRYGHQVLHHRHVNDEDVDPDLVVQHASPLKRFRVPLPLRYLVLLGVAMMWKIGHSLLYYGLLDERRCQREGIPLTPWRGIRGWLRDAALPYAFVHFALLPLLFLPLGWWCSVSVLINSLLAELLTNAHTFVVTSPTHAGDDLRIVEGETDVPHAYRQIVGTANYRSGGVLHDYLHLWMNYHIEHHLWPNLPMLEFMRARPRLERLCREHGVPYVHERVDRRFRRMSRLFAREKTLIRES